MKWLFWNIKGVNKRYKQKKLKKYISSKKIKFAAIVETRVKEHNASKVMLKVIPGWNYFTNYQHAPNGRVWLTWDPQWYTITLLRTEAQLIHYLV